MTDEVFCLWTEILILETKKRNTRLRRHLTYERYSLYIYHLKRYYSWRRLLLLVGLNWVSSPPFQGYEMWPTSHFFLLPSNGVLTYNHVSTAFYIILCPFVLPVSKYNRRLLKQHSQLATSWRSLQRIEKLTTKLKTTLLNFCGVISVSAYSLGCLTYHSLHETLRHFRFFLWSWMTGSLVLFHCTPRPITNCKTGTGNQRTQVKEGIRSGHQ